MWRLSVGVWIVVAGCEVTINLPDGSSNNVPSEDTAWEGYTSTDGYTTTVTSTWTDTGTGETFPDTGWEGYTSTVGTGTDTAVPCDTGPVQTVPYDTSDTGW